MYIWNTVKNNVKTVQNILVIYYFGCDSDIYINYISVLTRCSPLVLDFSFFNILEYTIFGKVYIELCLIDIYLLFKPIYIHIICVTVYKYHNSVK